MSDITKSRFEPRDEVAWIRNLVPTIRESGACKWGAAAESLEAGEQFLASFHVHIPERIFAIHQRRRMEGNNGQLFRPEILLHQLNLIR